MRHVPPLGEKTKSNLLLGPITNPSQIIWYNKVHKVSKDKASSWLKMMVALVELPSNMFANRSRQAILITCMGTSGVPDEMGMLVSSHLTSGGY